MTGDPLALEVRDGLPDALRVLLADYPREAWEADPNFSALIRFWLDRHLMFRRLVAMLADETEAGLDGGAPERFGRALGRLGSTLVGELHMHHRIEDAHYFPVLADREARIAHGFGMLDRDHHALDARLQDFTTDANDLLGGLMEDADPKTRIARFRPALDGLGRLLDRHLTDEEELVVPVLLKYGSAGIG